ncbi:MAG: GNAT family N-acetyltransferase [Candidatus Thorarchaeota archaeon]
MKSLTFSSASIEDAAQIAEINMQHLESGAEGGFLVIAHDTDDIAFLIRSMQSSFFVAMNIDGLVLAYVEVVRGLEISLLDALRWDSVKIEGLCKAILSEDYAYVKQLAVRKGFQHQGVASFLYQELERYLNVHLVAFTANKPIRNIASEKFHERQGYTKVATLDRRNFGKFPEYRSYFFVKQKFGSK